MRFIGQRGSIDGRWTHATGVVLWRFQYMGIQS